MIEDIRIRDFALIDSLSLDFKEGFTVFTGETGTGKSILIGAVSFLLGGKFSPDMIRSGAAEACVAGTLRVAGNTAAEEWLAARGLETEDGSVLLKRVAKAAGKSSCWIQGGPVTRTELAEFTSFLVDIHGQHDHQSLLRVGEHRRFLDAYAGIEDEVAAFGSLYSRLTDARRRREEMDAARQNRAERAELLAFAAQEIAAAALEPGEDGRLEAEEKRLSLHEKLCASLEQGLAVLTADDAGDSCGVLPLLKKASSLLETAAGVDPAFAAQTSRLENAFYEIEDAAAELERRLHTEVFDPQRLEAVEERLSLLYRLKKKYGPSLEDVMAYGETAARELETLANWDENRSALDGEISALEKELLAAGNRISEKRAAASAGMAHAVEDILRMLGMAGTRFQVSLQPKGAEGGVRTASQYGFDDIEFRISANPGEPLRPLAKIASGGEISRVMLALKTVLAGADKTGTLIFDEIDTGIGGEVAVAVGTHIRNLSRSRQILCITHLASIACQADNHIVIEKKSSGGETRTSAREIREQDREEEISRMLSGGKGGEVSLHHARELLEKYSGGRHA